jgi:tetratricopeptide (TPR) repeat protein
MIIDSVEQMLAVAMGYHQAGRLAEAEGIYRQILAHVPDHAGALHKLGCLALAAGHMGAAIELIGQAVTIEPAAAAYHCDLGESYRRAGETQRAISCLCRAIELEPRLMGAHYHLGTALKQAGRTDESIAAFRHALALKPDAAEVHCTLGNALTETGALGDAIAAYRRAIELKPDLAAAHCNLGNALLETGAVDEAILACRRALALKPDSAAAHNNLGNALRKTGAIDDAIAAFRRAISLKPEFAEALSNLGNALCEKGAVDDAVAAYRRALVLQPDSAAVYRNLGGALTDTGALDAAVAALRRAIELEPDFADAYSDLGLALQETKQLDEAIAACRQAVVLKPSVAEVHYNLAHMLLLRGDFPRCCDEAIAACRQAVALKPSFADAHYNLALMLLLRGDFREGWAEHEWRWRVKDFVSPYPSYGQPQWDGSDLAGRTILLHWEQGFGDTIQFIRYVPLVAERCGKVVVKSQPQLHRLLQSMPGVDQWILPGEPLPPFDAHCPLMSLPLALGTTVQTIPGSVPYLHADSRAIECWRERLARDSVGPKLKLGLVWAGSATQKNDRRSLPLSLLAPLVRVRGVDFYSLQKGEPARQAMAPPGGMNLIDWTEELRDFADTAALLAGLDLVITVDTAVAHLAGAMGKDVWVLVPFEPDWRWPPGRDASPWYPTARLFRQQATGRWNEVIERVAGCLALESDQDHRQHSDQDDFLVG